MDIKPIETRYKGYRFRSRLEARWAVCFDAWNEPYDYEPEGFVLKDDLLYLPDFRLINHHSGGQLWIEIKPNRELSEDEMLKALRFTSTGENELIILCGSPWYDTVGYSFSRADRSRSITKVMPMQCPSSIEGTKSFKRDHAPHLAWVSANAINEIVEKGHSLSEANSFVDFVTKTKWMTNGYCAARSARFEHGESGAK